SRTRTAARGIGFEPSVQIQRGFTNTMDPGGLFGAGHQLSAGTSDMIGDPIPPSEIARAESHGLESGSLSMLAKHLCGGPVINAVSVVEGDQRATPLEHAAGLAEMRFG